MLLYQPAKQNVMCHHNGLSLAAAIFSGKWVCVLLSKSATDYPVENFVPVATLVQLGQLWPLFVKYTILVSHSDCIACSCSLSPYILQLGLKTAMCGTAVFAYRGDYLLFRILHDAGNCQH